MFHCVGRRKPSTSTSSTSSTSEVVQMTGLSINPATSLENQIERSETRSKPIPVPSGGDGGLRHYARRRGSSLLSEMNDMTTLVKQCNQCGQDLLLWCDGAAKHRYARVGDHNFGFCGDECWAEWINVRTSAASSLTESMGGAGSFSNPARSPLYPMSATNSYSNNQKTQQQRPAYASEESSMSMSDETDNNNNNNKKNEDDIALTREQDDSPEAYLNKIISNQLKSLKYHTSSSSTSSSLHIASSLPDSITIDEPSVGKHDSMSSATQQRAFGSTGMSLPTEHGLRLSNPNQSTKVLATNTVVNASASTVASAPSVHAKLKTRIERCDSDSMWGDDSCASNNSITTKSIRTRSLPLSQQLQWRSLNNSKPRSLLAAALGTPTPLAAAATVAQSEGAADAADLI